MAFCSVRTAVLDHGEAVAIAPAALSVVMPREMRRDSLLKGTELILHGIELFVHLIDLKLCRQRQIGTIKEQVSKNKK